jgi:aspartate/methionine/tyrosine aminotransferase
VTRFSRRLPPETRPNAITSERAALDSSGAAIVDLTESNPTRVGLAYASDLLDSLASPAALTYSPQPLGLESARAAVAADCARRGARVDPDRVVLAASTSEAYAWLFKLFCNPGDAILAPQPSYPLFEHLARLEGVRLVPYAIEYHGRWEIDVETVAAAPAETRLMLAVSPNNPTGHTLSSRELAQLTAICRDRGWPLVVDEVFADYTLDEPAPLTDVAATSDVLTFTLGGASKTLGLPQVKLGWIVVGGPGAERQAALAMLELIADTYLSVSTPVQVAAPDLLRRAAPIREAIHDRVRVNLRRARELAAAFPSCRVLRVDGGWAAPIRIPATRSEEATVLELLRRERVFVHPGYFFDFSHEAFLVVSLLPEPAVFGEALERVLRFVHT